jgi:hypothetical protein
LAPKILPTSGSLIMNEISLAAAAGCSDFCDTLSSIAGLMYWPSTCGLSLGDGPILSSTLVDLE